jgi:hypothetical protein
MRFWCSTAFIGAPELPHVARMLDEAGYHGALVSGGIIYPKDLRTPYPYPPHPGSPTPPSGGRPGTATAGSAGLTPGTKPPTTSPSSSDSSATAVEPTVRSRSSSGFMASPAPTSTGARKRSSASPGCCAGRGPGRSITGPSGTARTSSIPRNRPNATALRSTASPNRSSHGADPPAVDASAADQGPTPPGTSALARHRGWSGHARTPPPGQARAAPGRRRQARPTAGRWPVRTDDGSGCSP